MAGRPMTRTIDARDTASASDAIEEWVNELEGYDDLHASAAMRRDMFRKLASNVVAEVLK
jgi:CO/xanthine dehydrogenase FAD-binding subunit